MAIAQRERIFVGTNQYPNPDDEAPGESSKPTPTASLKETNNEVEIDRNRLIQSISNALEGGSALGDLVPALFDLTKLDVRIIRPYRGAQAFEELRQSTEAHEKTPTVLTLPLGSKKMRKARSSFAVNFFGCVGYDIQEPLGFESVDEAIDAVQKNHPDIVVLCSSDKEYEDLVPKLSKRLDSLDQKPITVLAGYPKDKVDEYSNNGIDEFIYSNCNVLETLQRFQQKLGIK
jgi:methylmalonyl-CoA mutase